MSRVRQLGLDVDVEFTAGSPFLARFQCDDPSVVFSSPSVTMRTNAGDLVSGTAVPAVSASAGLLTCTWSTTASAAANTNTGRRALGYTFEVRALVNGEGPYPIYGGRVTVWPFGVATTNGATDVTATGSVLVGGVTISGSVMVGTGLVTAARVSIADALNFYTGTTAEAALQEIPRKHRRVINIADYGSTASADNTTAFANAISDAIAQRLPLYIPAGTWQVGKSPAGAFCIQLRSGLEIFGEGPSSIIRQNPMVGTSGWYVRLFSTISTSPVTDIYVHDLCLDGNSANQTENIFPPGHPSEGLEINARHAFFFFNVQRANIQRVEMRFFTGHGVSCYHDTTDVRVEDCWVHDTTSNALTVTGGAQRIWFVNNLLQNTKYTGIDFEPYIGPGDIHIINNTITRPTNPGSKAMSVGGNTDGVQLKSARIIGNRCYAPVNIVWGEDIEFAHNHVTIGADDSNTWGLQINRLVDDCRIVDNTFEGGAGLGTAMIGLTQAASEAPNNIQIRGNTMMGLGKDAVYVLGATNVNIADNDITFATRAVGLNLRASAEVQSIRAHGNRIRNSSAPVFVTRVGSFQIQDLNVHDNIFDDAGTTTDFGIEFATATPFVTRAQLSRNHFGPNITTRYRRLGAVTTLLDGERLEYALSDETTGLTTGTKLTARAPFRFHLVRMSASLRTASTSGVVQVNMLANGSTVFSTQLTIDQDETTSRTAATPAVISTNNVPDDAVIEFVVVSAGTGATGLKVSLEVLRAS